MNLTQIIIYVFSGMLTIIGWFTVNTLNKIDKNQTLLFQNQTDFQIRLSRLEGAHEYIHGKER